MTPRSRPARGTGPLDGLVTAALEARSRAYAPYSRYRVGAAILTRSGGVYTGCNVENSTFGATLCAERSAVAAMITGGDREPVACVVATAGPEPGSPCGICRQVLAEFALDLKIVLVVAPDRPGGEVTARKTTTLAKLLPMPFRLRDVAKKG